jgi:hypothetical protein
MLHTSTTATELASAITESPEKTSTGTNTLPESPVIDTTTIQSEETTTPLSQEDIFTNSTAPEAESLNDALSEKTSTDTAQKENLTGATTSPEETSGNTIASTSSVITDASTITISTSTDVSTETSKANTASTDSIICDGWILGMMGISSIVAVIFLISLIISRKQK